MSTLVFDANGSSRGIATNAGTVLLSMTRPQALEHNAYGCHGGCFALAAPATGVAHL